MSTQVSTALLVLLVSSCCWPTALHGQCELTPLKAAEAAEGDGLGASASLRGDVAVIGRPASDAACPGNPDCDSGSAHVLRLQGGSWVEEQEITASDGAARDRFGTSVAVDGDLLVVGAPRADVAGDDSGAASVFRFDGSAWIEEQKLVPLDASAGSRFGHSVAIREDRIAVGAPEESSAGNDAGAVYVFRRVGAVWLEEEKLVGSDTAFEDHLGWSVSMSEQRIAAGAPGAASGTIYVFRHDGSAWLEEAILTASDADPSSDFASVVATDGDVILVGAPLDDDAGEFTGSLYAYAYNGVEWAETQKLSPSDATAGQLFGYSISTSGNVAVIGAVADGFTGSIYVYRRRGGLWSEEAEVAGNDRQPTDNFGRSVAIDGDRVVAGSFAHDHAGYNAGAAYFYELSGGEWTNEQEFLGHPGVVGNLFGQSVALLSDLAVVGAPLKDAGVEDSGSTYVFRQLGDAWLQEAKLMASDREVQDLLGASVSAIGDVVVVGAPGKGGATGATYIYREQGGSWVEEQKLTASDGESGDRFGEAVSAVLGIIVVGAPGDDGEQGAIYVYREQGGTWVQEVKLTASDGAAGDAFGAAVAVVEDPEETIAAGAPGDDTLAGAVYVFRHVAGSWIEANKLEPFSSASEQRYGTSVSLAGERLVIGAPEEMRGSVYTYEWTGSDWLLQERIEPIEPGNSDGFGSSVSVLGDRLVVGFPTQTPHNAVYLYQYQDGDWVEEQTFFGPPAGMTLHRFGTSVSIGPEAILAGAMNLNPVSSGDAYLLPAAACPVPGNPYLVYFSDGVGPSGSEVVITTLLDFPEADHSVRGWQSVVCHDDELLSLLDAVSGETVLTINNGGPPDYEIINIFPEGVEQGVVISVFGVDPLEPGEGYELLDLRYHLEGPNGEVALVEYCTIMNSTVLTIDGAQSVTPEMEAGAIAIEEVPFVRGDADGNGIVELADAILSLSYQFQGGPSGCLDALDTNDDGVVNVADPVYTLSYQLGQGPPPPQPFPLCGTDPTGGSLGCGLLACP